MATNMTLVTSHDPVLI